MAQDKRDVPFANEAYLIGVLQAASGASLVAALSQGEPLIQLTGKVSFLTLLIFRALTATSHGTRTLLNSATSPRGDANKLLRGAAAP